MKRNVTEHDFTEAFRDYGRNDEFSYEGLKALYEWFEEYEEGTGEEIELDVVGICCDFSEYDSALEAAEEYGYEPDPLEYYLDNMDTLEMSIDEARSASHQGPCDEDVRALSEVEHIARQLDAIGADEIREEIGEIGAWDEEDLKDDDENRQRLLWIACGHIVEEYDEEEAEENAIEWLQDRTTVIVVPAVEYLGNRSFAGSVIVRGF